MTSTSEGKYLVAVIGAGPAGIFAAKQLVTSGAYVVLFNRDIKPGGLAEYGIYPAKHKMKDGLRKQFHSIIDDEDIVYYGNVSIGDTADLKLEDLRELGFQAILVTVGAQGTKWLGLPGEEFRGVYHAKDLVYHYNSLPPYSEKDYPIGERAALIGVGNVMMDIAHWMVRRLKIKQVIAVARRGPAEVKFTKKEMQNIANNLDFPAFESEMARVEDRMRAVEQDVERTKSFILSGTEKALEPVSSTKFSFQFLSSPSAIIANEDGSVIGLEIEDTRLIPRNGDTKAQGMGTKRTLEVDTVVFCIGDRVDETLGLPIQWNEFAKNPEPLYPIKGISYEAYDPEAGKPIEGVFLAGWAREASSGLVGSARKDGTDGASAVMTYLAKEKPLADIDLSDLHVKLATLNKRVITKEDWWRIVKEERSQAQDRGLPGLKFTTNAEMLSLLE